MTRRNEDWHLLDLDSDPVPVDGDDIREVAGDFRARGDVMNRAKTTLEQVADLDDWKGLYAIELADKASEATSDLGKAASKYVDAAAALTTYAGEVDTARAGTLSAVQAAVEADATRRANQTSLLDGVDDPTDADEKADDQREKRLEKAGAALDSAKTALASAMNALDDAAKTCADAIRRASENFKDSRMDDLKGVASAVIKFLVDALQIIAIIVAVIIIAALIIGSGGAFLGFLVAASFWLGVAIFGLTAVQVAMGDATGEDLAWASLGLIGGGVTKAGTSVVRGGLTTIRGAMAVRAANNARNSLPRFVKFLQKVPIARIAGDFVEARKVSSAIKALDDSLTAVKTADKNWALRALEVDDMMNNFNTIKAMKGMNPTLDELAQLDHLKITNLVGLGGGQLLEDIALGHDMLGSPGQVADTINTIKDPSSLLDSMGTTPDIGTTPTPVGR